MTIHQIADLLTNRLGSRAKAVSFIAGVLGVAPITVYGYLSVDATGKPSRTIPRNSLALLNMKVRAILAGH